MIEKKREITNINQIFVFNITHRISVIFVYKYIYTRHRIYLYMYYIDFIVIGNIIGNKYIIYFQKIYKNKSSKL